MCRVTKDPTIPVARASLKGEADEYAPADGIAIPVFAKTLSIPNADGNSMTSTYADRIATYDSTDMYSVLCDYPGQIRTGLDIGNTVNLSTIDTNAIRNLLICGMGGSAIGGDIFRVFAASKSPVPILVNRDYGLPAWVDHGTLVVVLSYSGGTEESLSAYDEAGVRGAARIVVTSGGELLERAERDGVPVAIVPGGLAPRCALGYLFFAAGDRGPL